MVGERLREKRWYAPILTKAQDAADGAVVVRYAFTSDKMDEGGDVITRAATEKAIEDWRQWRNIRLQHDPSKPIGKAIKIGEGDGLEWNQMDVRVDAPDVVPLVKGDDPTLAGASVGIMVNEYQLNEDEAAVKKSPWGEPWIITDYTFVEISLVDHPMNYDAKRVGEVTEQGRSRMLFMQRDPKEATMSKKLEEVLEPEDNQDLTPEEPEEKSVQEEMPEPEVVEGTDSEPEGGDPTSEYQAKSLELLAGIAESLKALGDVMTQVHKAVTPQEPEEEVVEDSDIEESVDEQEAPLEEERVEEEVEEGQDGLDEIKAMVNSIHEKLLNSEVESEEVEQEDQPDLEKTIESIVERVIMEKMKLQPRKTKALESEPEQEQPEEEVEEKSTPVVNPRERLRDGVKQIYRSN